MGQKAQVKPRKTSASVAAFLAKQPPERRADCEVIARIMRKVTGAPAVVWGPSIVGFGSYHYVYESGREGDWMLTGFSSRAQHLTLYIMAGFPTFAPLMQRLGKYTTGKSCLYFHRLADVDMNVLTELIDASVRHMRAGGTPAY